VCGPELLELVLTDEPLFHQVMDFITGAIVAKVVAWRQYLKVDLRPNTWGFADDAIQFLSVRTYRDHVLPYHRRLLRELAGEGPLQMHLCGNVQRHLPLIARELNVRSFDTGYPIDFATLREQVGDDVEIYGGIPAGDLLTQTPAQIYAQAKSVLQSGVTRGGKFLLKEANNLAPMTPPENLAAMYTAVREFGQYAR
jgi:uroporphyrinogen-III decarboxylase